MQFTEKDIKRFWGKVAITINDELCWEWQAGKVADGYGHFRYGKTHLKAHRVSWELKNGEIASGLEICHSCDNPACVNPKHLFTGTRLDNMKDMVAKGRGNHKGGAQSRHHKLTAEQVKEIRFRHSVNGISCRAIAKEFKVAFSTIARIVNKQTWSTE